MQHHTEVINHIIKTKSFKRYLEIGTQYGANFNAVQCAFKLGVDPDPKAVADYKMTSTEFFAKNVRMFDLIFIDGLHEAHQVRNDFIDAMEWLTDRGVIVLHDTSPAREEWTHVPRDSKIWTGDVYKFVCDLQADFVTLDFDHGITVVKKRPYTLNHTDITWEAFNIYRKDHLKIVDEEEFIKWLIQ